MFADRKYRAEVYAVKGRACNCQAAFSEQAEALLSKAVKLSPTHADCWTALGVCLWKKGDRAGAKSCLLQSVKLRPSIEACCELSILIRQDDKGSFEQIVAESIDFAKKAIALDVRSEKGWYVLGNAMCAKHFNHTHAVEDLKKALAAYNRSQSLGGACNPDLYFNRASVHRSLLDLSEARADWTRCQLADPSLQAACLSSLRELEAIQFQLQQLLLKKLAVPPSDISRGE